MPYRAIPEYYDYEYQFQEMLAEDVPFFLQQCPRPQTILELAVGTGRCAIPLAQAGHRVVGVDYDARMLRIAERKRDAVGLSPKQLRLARSNLLRLEAPGRFDWACVFFNTFVNFTTIDQQDRVLRGARQHLKPRGRIWIDIFQPNLDLLAQDHSTDLAPTIFHVPHLDRTVYKSTELFTDAARQVQRVIFHYHWFSMEGAEHHETIDFELTFIFPRELQLLLERNGFRLEKLYGNYDGSELAHDSPRMIARARAV